MISGTNCVKWSAEAAFAAVVASRIGPLLATGVPGALLVALGALFFIVPGLVLAIGFSLAAPIVVLETCVDAR